MSQLVNQAGQKIAFPASGDALALGRGNESCRVLKTLRGFLVQGSAASNVSVNGQKVQEHLLKEGDVIQLGASSYTFYTGAVPAPAPAAAAAAPTKGTERRTAPAGAAPKPTTQRVVAANAAGPRASQRIVATATPAPAKPASGVHQRPATGTHQKPATGTHTKPATGTHQKPATAVMKPSSAPSAGATEGRPATQPIKTGTARVEKSTQSVATKPATGRFKPGTQRIEGQPKPTTGRHRPAGPPSSRRVVPAKTGGGSILPKSKVVKILMFGSIGSLAIVIGVLVAIRMGKPDQAKIIAEAKAELEAISKLPPEKILEAADRIKAVYDNPQNKEWAVIELKPKRGMAEKILSDAKNYSEAKTECAKPLEEVRKLQEKKKEKGKLSKDEVNPLYDKIKHLAEIYSDAITYGKELDEARTWLKGELESDATAVPWETAYFQLTAATNKLMKGGNFVEAIKEANRISTLYEAYKYPDRNSKITKEITDINRKAVDYVKDLIAEAKQMKDEGKKAEGLQKLRDAVPGLQGNAAYDKLDEAIRTF